MKSIILFFLLLITINGLSQDQKTESIKDGIEALSQEIPGLTQKVNINLREATLSSFLLAVSEVHKVNISVDSSLNSISIVNNFTNVTVADLLIFLCKEYQLKIDFTGNILAIKRYDKPSDPPAIKTVDARYVFESDLLSLNLKDDKLYDVFKKVTDESGKNIVFTPGLENKLLTVYIKNMPFDDAMSKLAFANNLEMTKTKDNFYLFESSDVNSNALQINGNQDNSKYVRPSRNRKSNFYFNIIDQYNKLLEVDFENTSIANIVYDIGNELGIDVFVASPLERAGTATVKAKSITFDELLQKIFEGASQENLRSQSVSSTGQGTDSFSRDVFTFAKKGDFYFFGLKNQLLLRNIKSIPLQHRSIEMMSDPTKEQRSAGRISNPSGYVNFNAPDFNKTGAGNQNSSDNLTVKAAGSILDIIPDEIKEGIDVKIDTELNSFIVSGPNENISRFESFIKYIDKEIPVILIEVMILEISRSATVETGISAGLGDKPTSTSGSVFPNVDMNLGSKTINNIINNFEGFGSLNIGNVVPNFYLSLKALETNGNINIRSTPRLSTLNGHRAHLSIGETTYYVVTNQNYYGSQIPQASEVRNYQPIDAELSLSIKPLVSGNGEITMDIRVVQSSFNGQKVDKNAPPGINSREFTSIIRVKNGDVVVLGGLEEKVKNDTGSGVPLLSRIPVIKWLFSSRKREDSKKKLSVIIKPTVLY